jgi:hypothetical protein
VEYAGKASAFSSSSHRSQWFKSRAATDWNTDTGASSHMTPHRPWFVSYSRHRVPIRLANDSVIYSEGIGSVEFIPTVGDQHVIFHDVLHVPNLASNLLSLYHLTRVKGYEIHASGSKVNFSRNGVIVFTATVDGTNTGYLDGAVALPNVDQRANGASTLPLTQELWHRRLAHLNHADVLLIDKNKLVTGMKITSPDSPNPLCEPCTLGKQRRHNIPRGPGRRRIRRLHLVHTDLKGPMPVATPEGYRYWMTFIDDSARFRVVAYLRKKSDAFAAIRAFKAYAEAETGEKWVIMRCDGGGEYISLELRHWAQEHGIQIQITEPGEPHQNGVAERANLDMANAVTALLVEANLPPSFWRVALNVYIHVFNRTPTSALPSTTTPYAEWKPGRRPDVSYFRIFGCLAYVLIPKKKRKALEVHSHKCIFVGYPEGTKAWLFWDPEDRKFITSSHAVFDERYFPGNSPINLSQMPTAPDSSEFSDDGGDDDVPPPISMQPPPAPPAPPHLPPHPIMPSRSPSPSPPPHEPPPSPPHRQLRERGGGSLNVNQLMRQQMGWSSVKAPEPPSPTVSSPLATPSDSDHENDHDEFVAQAFHAGIDFVYSGQYDDYLTIEEALEYAYDTSEHVLKASSSSTEPRSYAEAMKRPSEERMQWHNAAVQEIEALVQNGTFELVELPPGRRTIGSRWVFKVKRNADGSIERYKARLVAQGFGQRPGFDYQDTFAATPKWASLRAILALAAIENLVLYSVDISNAFLNGKLNEEVYMKQPEGFEQKTPDWVLRLWKSIYGLKQAGRVWHETLHKVLVGMGFRRITCEHSVWVYGRGDERVIIPVYVDDMTIAAKSRDRVDKIIQELKKHFKLRELGPTSWLLGVEVKQDLNQGTVTLSQRQYCLDILERFGMSDCDSVVSPMDPGVKLSKDQSPKTHSEAAEMSSIPYINAVGALAYLAIATRPDLAYVVGVLARFSTNPGHTHWTAVKRVLRYIKGTLDHKITYTRPSKPPTSPSELFESFTDADHGGNPDNGRSTSGFIILMAGGAICWASRLQRLVTLSTTEAEFVAAVAAGQEILWLRNFFSELGYIFTSASTLHIDNLSALSVAKNPEHHGRMKHLDLRYYWLRDEVYHGRIHIIHCRTDDMPADLLTKPLGRKKVEDMVRLIGMGT